MDIEEVGGGLKLLLQSTRELQNSFGIEFKN